MQTPKEAGFSMPAEWYPHSGCWMAWPCHIATWQTIGLQRAREAYARVARAIQQFEPVTMLVNPGDEASAQTLCGPNIRQISLSINDSWLRDTGPSFLLNAENELAGVDWMHNAWGGNYKPYDSDNQIASAVLDITQARSFHAPLVMEGGAFHVDGEGTLLTTRECLLNPNRNPHLSEKQITQYLQNYLGIEVIIWLNQGLIGDETNGHVDEIACFIAPGRVFCLITDDHKDVNYSRLQANYTLLRQSRDAKGRLLDVIPIEQPPATYLNQERLTLSYINFYTANGGIVMPAFGHKTYDDAAEYIFKQQFPDRIITQIDALDVFAGGGGIHCITQQQPKGVQKN
jgi:agmatine deiminase